MDAQLLLCPTKTQFAKTKILERKLSPASSSHQGNNSEKTWCKRRAQYYQHRLQISENINNHVLKLMKKHDLEVLLSALEQNTITSLEVNVIIILFKRLYL